LVRQTRDKTLIERSDRVSELMRRNAESHAQLATQQREQELAARDHRIEQLELRLMMLCQFLSVGGYDLPKGL
jgi:hypothetical protein